MEEFEIKKQLIEKAKELAENPKSAGIFKEIQNLRKKWHHSFDDESLLDVELENEFNSYLDKIYAVQGEAHQLALESKQAIIAKAKEVANDNNFKRATAKMNDLMKEWKESGNASKEQNDQLWEEFKTIKDGFYEKKQAYFEDIKNKLEASKLAKEELIQKAIEANEITDVRKLTKVMDELMEEWKKAGTSGREFDDDLWAKFKEQRTIFYKKKNDFNHEMKEMYAKRTEQKKEIIAQAKRCLAISEFSKEEADQMKAFRQQWKEIGSAGRENEDALWTEFSTIVNKYFENKKFYDEA